MASSKRIRSKNTSAPAASKRRRLFDGNIVDPSKGDESVLQVKDKTTAQSTSPSPLLQLPAELRAQIWQHAYGNLCILVTRKSFNKPPEQGHTDLKYAIITHAANTHHIKTHPPMSSLRVCKQIHHEALAAFYASSTFHFTDRQALHAFALAPHACVPRIRHITIARLDDHWSETLTPSLMGRLKSLRGIDATYLYPCCNGHAPFPHAQDVRWKNVWRMIRALRQHKLNAHVVRFDVLVYDYSKVDYVAKMNGSFDIEGVRLRAGEDGYEDLVRLEGGFKEALLRYTPRRLSRRGGGED